MKDKPSDSFWEYVTGPLIKKIAELGGKHLIWVEYHTQSIGWMIQGEHNGFHYTTIWATPFWDGNLETVDCQLSDDDGHSEDSGISVPFSFKDITMDVEIDAKRYLSLVGKAIQDFRQIT